MGACVILFLIHYNYQLVIQGFVIHNNCLYDPRPCQAYTLTSRVKLYRLADLLPLLPIPRRQHICNLFYLGVRNQLSDKVNSMFSPNNDQHDTPTCACVENKLQVPWVKSNIIQGNLRVRGPVYYNKLSCTIKNRHTKDFVNIQFETDLS